MIMCFIVPSLDSHSSREKGRMRRKWVAPKEQEKKIDKVLMVKFYFSGLESVVGNWNIIAPTPRSSQQSYGPPFVCHNIWALLAHPRKPILLILLFRQICNNKNMQTHNASTPFWTIDQHVYDVLRVEVKFYLVINSFYFYLVARLFTLGLAYRYNHSN